VNDCSIGFIPQKKLEKKTRTLPKTKSNQNKNEEEKKRKAHG
jgi:hypothetical protein